MSLGLPGDIPGLLQAGSPLVGSGGDKAVVVVELDQLCIYVAQLTEDPHPARRVSVRGYTRRSWRLNLEAEAGQDRAARWLAGHYGRPTEGGVRVVRHGEWTDGSVWWLDGSSGEGNFDWSVKFASESVLQRDGDEADVILPELASARTVAEFLRVACLDAARAVGKEIQE